MTLVNYEKKDDALKMNDLRASLNNIQTNIDHLSANWTTEV